MNSGHYFFNSGQNSINSGQNLFSIINVCKRKQPETD